jgi:hypothetical protein
MGTHQRHVDDNNPYPRAHTSGPGGSVGSLVVRVGSVIPRSTTHEASHTCATGIAPCDQCVRKHVSAMFASSVVRGRPQTSSARLAHFGRVDAMGTHERHGDDDNPHPPGVRTWASGSVGSLVAALAR